MGSTRPVTAMTIDKVVGSGTFGVVYRATDPNSGDLVALKRIKMEKETQGFPITAIREIKILSSMAKHDNIIYLREIVTCDTERDPNDTSQDTASSTSAVYSTSFNIGDVFMVFDFVDYDLCGLLKSPGFIMSDDLIRCFLMQLLSGVNFLHENKILHRDLKSANLLVTRSNVLKIADWGLARLVLSKEQRLTNPVVTLWYRSPEVICGSKSYGPEIDIWSVG